MVTVEWSGDQPISDEWSPHQMATGTIDTVEASGTAIHSSTQEKQKSKII